MSETAPRPAAAPPLDLSRYLPGIYQAGQEERSPFAALLAVLTDNHHAMDARLNAVPLALDPRTAPSAFDHDGQGFLEMLAEWVALDPALLGARAPGAAEGHDPPHARPRPGFLEVLSGWGTLDLAQLAVRSRGWTERREGPDPRARVLRHLVENAAPLHAARGTPAGTRYLLEVLFDAGVEILEWRWPAPFQLGEAATLGADTLLMGEPPPGRHATLVWDAEWLDEAMSWAGARPERFQTVEITAGGRKIRNVIGLWGRAGSPPEEEPAEGTPRFAAFQEALARLQEVLRRELPADVLAFVGFKLPEGPADTGLRPFIVGREGFATLGRIQIQREA